LLATKNIDKVIITGDLNTLDERFGHNHNQRYKYLDDVLNSYEIISNPKVCTRENHTLDITLATQHAKENVNRLSSDHLPTITKYLMPSRERSDTGSKNREIYTVVDKRTTMKKIHLEIKSVDPETVDLPEINNILKML
jgi:hypothetical protein